MKPSPIRELARRYAAGELSLEEYRKQRRHLIDAMCAGTLTLQYGETELRKTARRSLRWLAAIPVVVVVTIAIGVTLYSGTHHHPHEGAGVAHAARGAPGTQLLHSFTDANDWSTASVSRFLKQWNQLPAPAQQEAHNSYLFPRLLAQLHEQIVSQQAMLEIAPDPAAAAHHLAQLQKLSEALRDSPKD